MTAGALTLAGKKQDLGQELSDLIKNCYTDAGCNGVDLVQNYYKMMVSSECILCQEFPAACVNTTVDLLKSRSQLLVSASDCSVYNRVVIMLTCSIQYAH